MTRAHDASLPERSPVAAVLRGANTHWHHQIPDRLGLTLLFLILVAPFRIQVYLPIGGALLHYDEILEVTLMAVAVFRIACGTCRTRLNEALALGGIVLVITVTQAISGNTSWSSDAIQHGRSFLPFMTACLVALPRWQLPRRAVVSVAAVSVLCSGVGAAVIHVLFRQALPSLAVEHELLDIAAAGRMYWSGLVSSMLVPLLLCYHKPRVLSLTTLTLGLCLSFLMLNQSRTILVGFICASFVCLILNGVSLTRLVLVTLVIGLAGGLIVSNFMMSGDELALWKRRFGFVDIASEWDQSFDAGRVPLYDQYWDAISRAPLIGQGLGQPVALSTHANGGGFDFDSDISLVHIWIPLGGVGVFAWIWFIAVCARRSRVRPHLGTCPRACFYLLLIAIAISFNHDPFFRNSFSIAFAFILAAAPDTEARPAAVR